MASLVQKLETKAMAMTLLTLLLIGTACDDKMDTPTANSSAAKQVEVSLHIGFANEDNGISLSNTRTNNTTAGKNTATQQPAFDAQLISEPTTRAESVTPDKLYNLEIRQYDATTGTYINSPNLIAQQSIGSKLKVNLTQSDNCQLVIVAWGTSISNRLGTGSFSAACDVMIDQSAIKELPLTMEGMNKMPYYIHLPSVKVNADGTITNPDGTDVRLLLKRLATRVTLNWNYTYADYSLKEVRLEAVPTHYRAVPFINAKDNTYPSLFDQYTTIIVSDNITNQGSYSCWIPATLRGTSNKATSAYYRNKENAPTGSVYATFVAQNNEVERKKLNYRLYLGSNTSDNFDLNPNTNYNYQVNFKNIFPTNDRRVNIIDPIPASTNNEMPSPTANCFMVVPGGAFCFNPYKYYVNGENEENTLLQQWCVSSKIQSVKVLWQTKENGDLGDPVLGVVNSNNDHTNIVELKNGESFENARIYCRVAPSTSGGSGLIVAYDDEKETDNILWSWHIWVTDYKPDPISNENVIEPINKRKHKYIGNDAPDQYPMMDRNLGAIAGYMTIPPNPLEMSKTNGFHYQWGRKDLFPSSYTAEKLTEISGVTADTPVKGMLNRYGPDGISYVPISTATTRPSIQTAYQNPLVYYKGGAEWCLDGKNNWGSNKTVHDPCPAGWKIPVKENFRALFIGNYDAGKNTFSKFTPRCSDEIWNKGAENGGYLITYDNNNNQTYIRMAGYFRTVDAFQFVGQQANIWTSNYRYSFNYGYRVNGEYICYAVSTDWHTADAHSVRCIQERSK